MKGKLIQAANPLVDQLPAGQELLPENFLKANKGKLQVVSSGWSKMTTELDIATESAVGTKFHIITLQFNGANTWFPSADPMAQRLFNSLSGIN